MTKAEPAELALPGPAGGVRLSVRGQLPSGFVYMLAGGEKASETSCAGAAAPHVLSAGETPKARAAEVRP